MGQVIPFPVGAARTAPSVAAVAKAGPWGLGPLILLALPIMLVAVLVRR